MCQACLQQQTHCWLPRLRRPGHRYVCRMYIQSRVYMCRRFWHLDCCKRVTAQLALHQRHSVLETRCSAQAFTVSPPPSLAPLDVRLTGKLACIQLCRSLGVPPCMRMRDIARPNAIEDEDSRRCTRVQCRCGA